MTRSQDEFRLQVAVVQHLRLCAPAGCYFTALPFGEYRSPRTGARLKAAGVRAGAPDILILYQGRALGLELKAAKGRQNDAQRLTERDWIRAGGDYRVATGIDEALAVLRGWGILPENYSFEPARRRQASLQFEAA